MANTLQIITIQHELSMAIGLDLQLTKMLDPFMSVALRRLSLSALHIFYGNSLLDIESKENDINILNSQYLCFPKQQALQQSHRDWLQGIIQIQPPAESKMGFVTVEKDKHCFYFFPIRNFGSIVLERIYSPINNAILQALTAVFERLATSCLACLEHDSLLIEISARKKAEETIIRQAYIDSLTDLPNRKMLNINLKQAIALASRHKHFGALFFIDLDRFKIINDTLGHGVGDELLKKIGQLLQNLVRKGDTLARVGGDEFILLVTDLASDENNAMIKAHIIAEKLAALVNEPVGLSNNVIHMTFSIGIAMFPSIWEMQSSSLPLSLKQQCDTIIKNADIAMYRIKHSNRNGFRFYEPKMQAIAERRSNIEKHLHIGLARKEFELYYQPLVDQNGNIVAAEALLRWNSAELGEISPGELIPIAEESGLIIDLSRWIIDAACQFIAQLKSMSCARGVNYISVNVSPNQFRHQQFVEQISSAVKKHQVSIDHLRLEVTEGVAMGNIDSATKKMRQLVDKGLKFLLDDFGSGYSSLSYLHQLPLQTIKIDQSFIRNINKHPNNQVIVDAIIHIAEHFDLDCIAEGVESIDDFLYLKGKKLHAIQGYYFYQPMNSESFIKLLYLNSTN